MHLSVWKSTLVSWANALDVAAPVDFICDLGVEFFAKLHNFVSGKKGEESLDGALSYIKRFYPALVLDVELDENDTTLLATCFLILTSIHEINENLCQRVCGLPSREQGIIKNALVAFVNVPSSKITKDVLYATLAQLPDDESGDGHSSPKGTRYSCGGTPGSGSSSRRSSGRYQKLTRKLKSIHAVKQELQDDLEQARDTIVQLEGVIDSNKHEIAQLKDRLARAKIDRSNPCSPSPGPVKKECFKCKTFEKQVASLEGLSVENRLEISELKDSIDSLRGKITSLESEKRLQSFQLDEYEDQCSQMKDAMALLDKQKEDLLSEKKELQDIVLELRDAKAAANVSLEAVVPFSLANEVVDIQLSELRAELESKTSELIREREKSHEQLTLKGQQIISMENELLDLSNELDQVTSQYKSLRNEFLLSERLISHKNEELNNVHQELSKCQLEKAELEKKIDISKAVINVLKTDVARLTCEKQQFEATALEQLDQITAYEVRVNELEEAVNGIPELQRHQDEMTKELAAKEEVVAALNATLDDLQKQLRVERDHKQELQGKISTLQVSMAEKTHEIGVLKEALDRNEKINDELVTKCGQLDVLHRETSEKLASSLRKASDLEKQLHDKTLEIEKVNEESLALNSKILNTEAALAHQLEKWELLEQEKYGLQMQLNQLSDKVENQEKLLKEYEDEKVRLEKNTTILQERMELTQGLLEDSNKRVNEIEAENTSLQQQLDDCYKQISKSSDEIDALKSTLERESLQLQSSNGQLKEYKEHCQDLEVELNNLKTLYNALGEEHSSVQQTLLGESNKLLLLEKNNSDLEIKLASYIAEVKGMQDALENKEVAKCRLEKEVALLEEQKSQTQESLESSNSLVGMLQAEKASLLQQLEDSNEQIVKYADDMKSMKSALERELLRCSSLADEVKQLGQYKDRCIKLEEELTEQINLTKVLQDKCNDEQAALLEETKKLELLEQEKSDLTATVKGLSEEFERLQLVMDDHERAKSRLEEEVAILQKQNSQTQESLESSTNLVGMLHAEKASLLQELEDRNEQIVKYGDDMKSMKSALEQESLRCSSLADEVKQLGQYKDRCIKLEEELTEQINLTKVLQDKCNDSQATLLEEAKKLELLEQEKSDLTVTVRGLSEEFERLQLVIDDQERVKSRLEEELDILQKQNSQTQESLESSTNLVGMLHAEKASLLQQLEDRNEQIVKYGDDMKTMKSALEQKLLTVSSLTNDIARLSVYEGRCHDLEVELNDLTTRYDALREEHSSVQETLLGESSKLRLLENNNSDLDKKISSLLEDGKKMQVALEESEAAKSNLEVKIAVLEKQMYQTQESLESSDHLVKMLQAEKASLLQQLDDCNQQITKCTDSLKTFEERCLQLEGELTDERNLVNALRGDISIAKTALQEETRVGEMLREERSGLLTRIEEMSVLITEARATIDDYKNAQSKLELDISDTRAQLCKKTISLEETSNDLKEALLKNNQLQEEISRINTMTSTYLNDIEVLKSQLDSEQQNHLSIQDNLKSQIEEEKSISASNLAQMQALQKELESLQGYERQCAELSQAILADKSAIASLEKELENATEAVKAGHETNRTLEDKIAQVEAQLRESEKELSLTHGKLANVECACDGLKKEASERLAVIEGLQSDVDRLTKEKELMLSKPNPMLVEVENITRRLEFTSMELDVKNETILMMEATVKSHAAQISLLENRVSEKESIIARLERECDAAREATKMVAERDAVIAELQKENKLKCDSISKMAEELVQVSQTFNIEKTSLLDHTKNLEEFLVRSSDTEKFLQTQIDAQRKELDAKTELIGQLEEKLSLVTDKLAIERRDLTTKCDSLQAERDDLAKKCDKTMKMLDSVSANEGQMEAQLTRLAQENKELNEKLSLKVNDIDRYCHELEILQKSLKSTLSVNQQLEREVKALTQAKQQEISRLEKEKAELELKSKMLKPHVTELDKKIRDEYEMKLNRLKEKMISTYTRKLQDCADQNGLLKDELSHERSNRLALESHVQELSDKLIIVQEEKRALLTARHDASVFRQPYALSGAITNPAYESPPSPLHKAQSLDHLPTSYRGLDNFGADFSLDQSSSRRTSTSSNRSANLPKGIGKVFPAAEEEGEVFDNRYLADLKSGNCPTTSNSGPDRVSILQLRNSMCPPHLKSSYPVESQFFSPTNKEDTIKTPSKSSNKENQLKETAQRKVMTTPSKIKALFTGRR